MTTNDTPTTSTTPATPQEPTTWHAGVLLFDGFEPLDAIGPAQVLWSLTPAARAAGETSLPEVQVHLVAPTTDPVTAGHGMVIHPTVSYGDCPPLDLLVVPGGGSRVPESTGRGIHFYRQHEPTLDLVRAQAAGGALIASVCTGSFILAGAGLLAGRRAATHWSARPALIELMAERGEPFELVEERVVDDGDLVTGGGVSSGIDLAIHLVTRLFGETCGEAVTLLIERETPPPPRRPRPPEPDAGTRPPPRPPDRGDDP